MVLNFFSIYSSVMQTYSFLNHSSNYLIFSKVIFAEGERKKLSSRTNTCPRHGSKCTPPESQNTTFQIDFPQCISASCVCVLVSHSNAACCHWLQMCLHLTIQKMVIHVTKLLNKLPPLMETKGPFMYSRKLATTLYLPSVKSSFRDPFWHFIM